MLRLVEEDRWYRTVIASIYHMVPDVPGTEQLEAELEREAARLGVVSRHVVHPRVQPREWRIAGEAAMRTPAIVIGEPGA
jgi:hypothetical protein